MRIHMGFGRTGLDVEVPDANLIKILEAQGARPLAQPEAAVEQALAQPTGAAPLRDLARGKADAVVVICDMTRPVPNAVLLPPILRTLAAAGMPREAITILVATGLHRPNEAGELEAMVGREIAAGYRIVNHRATAAGEQVHLGVTARGTPIDIDRVYAHAALKLTTGYIEPHLMAGYSGGRKVAAIGCGGERQIRAVHSPAFIEHPRSIEGVTEGNILHEELTTIARRAGMDFMVNVTLDRARRITGVFAGDLKAAFDRGCAFARASVRDTVDAPCDIVITSCGGFPQDCTWYQSAKGLTGARHIARKGGTIILLTACEQGLGGERFRALCASIPTVGAFERDFIRGTRSEIDQWQVHNTVRALRHCDCVVVDNGLTAEDRAVILPRCTASFDEALASALAKHGSGARIAVIPDGPNIVAQLS